MTQLSHATEAANPLRALADRYAPAALEATERGVGGRCGRQWGKRARVAMVACGRVVEASVLADRSHVSAPSHDRRASP